MQTGVSEGVALIAGCLNAEGKAISVQQVQVLVSSFEALVGRAWAALAVLEADFRCSSDPEKVSVEGHMVYRVPLVHGRAAKLIINRRWVPRERYLRVGRRGLSVELWGGVTWTTLIFGH